jgi:ATP-dependent Clp protease, protease subunit
MKRALLTAFFICLIVCIGLVTILGHAAAPSAEDYIKKALTSEFIQAAPNQVVLLNDVVFDKSIDLVIEQLETARKTKVKTAYLVITSPGGEVMAGGRLLAYMQSTPLNVVTVCQSICASMAAHIFEAGSRRLILDKSLLMFHRASGGVQGTVEQMLSQILALKIMVDRMDANAATRSGIPYDKFKEIIGKDLWIEGYTAVSMHLADQLAFLSYDASSAEVFSLHEQLNRRKILVPETLKEAMPKSLK